MRKVKKKTILTLEIKTCQMKIEKEKIIQLIMLKNKKMLLLINKNEFLKKVKS